MARRRSEQRLWLAGYVALLLLPLVLMLVSPHKESTPTTVFAVGMGFAAYVGMALQVVLASRAPILARAAGLDVLLRLHRYMGGALILLVALHILVFWIKSPWFRPWLYPPPISGPLEAQAGFVAALAMLLLGVTSYARRALRIGFERWRAIHLVLTVLAMGGAYLHVLLASDYAWSGPIRATATFAVLLAIAALVYLRVGRAFAATGRPYLLEAVRRERGAATTLRLAAAGHAGIPFRPGDFAWLRLDGRAYTLTEHPLSVASSTVDPRVVEFTAKESGDHTGRFSELQPGTVVLVDGPHGGAHPALPTAGYVLIVAGIGVTPAMSVLRTFAERGDRRPVQLVYGARDLEGMTFTEEVDQLAGQLELDVVRVLSRPAPGWSGHRGRVDAALLQRVLPADRTARNYLVCGPAGFAEATLDTLVRLGVPVGHVQAERFESV